MLRVLISIIGGGTLLLAALTGWTLTDAVIEEYKSVVTNCTRVSKTQCAPCIEGEL